MQDITESSHCRPGDITLTRVPGGYLIGRVLPPGGEGPWWVHVLTVGSFNEAAWQARALARRAGVRVWVHQGGDYYDPLPDSPTAIGARAIED